MLAGGLNQFRGKRVLLLQGPVGPFFGHLMTDLKAIGAQVFKVNFNAGDWFFSPSGLNYRGTAGAWPLEFERLVAQWRIDVVLLFGDQRPLHVLAHAVATRLGLEIGVFEEGYVRPDHVTFERFGVNGRSRLSSPPDAVQVESAAAIPLHNVGKAAYWGMVWYGFVYYLMGALGKPFFWRYVHHRPLSLLEVVPWVRSAWRKQWYRLAESGLQAKLTGPASGQYFLVPLQVFNDAQITSEVEFRSVSLFIEHVTASFATHAPADTWLVFKHHPMDRGYTHYGKVIRLAAQRAGMSDRVLYMHDQHLPTLLDHARGVVVVNSTVGLSALHHGVPTKVCGIALYDLPGLTYAGSLAKFWRAAPEAIPQRDLYLKFREHLVRRTQVNGSFYKRLSAASTRSGLLWNAELFKANSHRLPRSASNEQSFVTSSEVRQFAGSSPVIASEAMKSSDHP
jgi:capsular polysaccharide export protein